MYAMPVSKAKMTINARTMSISSSDTGEEDLLAEGVGKPGVLVSDQGADQVKVVGRRAWQAQALRYVGDDAPIGAGVRRGGSGAPLWLRAGVQGSHRVPRGLGG